MALGSQSSSRDNTMEVRMVHQILSPSVQDGDKTDLGAEMFGVGGNGEKSLGGGTKKEIIQHALVLEDQWRKTIG